MRLREEKWKIAEEERRAEEVDRCARAHSHDVIHPAFMRKCNLYDEASPGLMSRAITAAITTAPLDIAETKLTGCSFSDAPTRRLHYRTTCEMNGMYT